MNVDKALDLLRNAKKEKMDWQEVAAILEEVAVTKSWQEHFETATAWLRTAAEESRYSESMLRRVPVAARFLQEMKREIPEYDALVGNAGPLRFSTVEVLKRIYGMDPAKAVDLFPSVVRREITHVAVVEILSEMVGPSPFKTARPGVTAKVVDPKRAAMRAYGRRSAREFAEAASSLVEQNVSKLCGDNKTRYHYNHFRFEYSAPDAVALKLSSTGIEWVDGFEFHHIKAGLMPEKRHQLLGKLALSATFFRCYWLVINKAGALAATIVKDLHMLELRSIGVMEVDLERGGGKRVLLEPRELPVPDRTASSRMSVMGRGIPGLVDF